MSNLPVPNVTCPWDKKVNNQLQLRNTGARKPDPLHLPICMVAILPPSLFLASSTLKSVNPFLARWLAADRPAMPAPRIRN